ncbi:MAG: tetratricopeptide repeat protein [Paludisphaera borealis]|uniref:tetratricopeptide repeat protein n=1 Tax=Paludisphaera borealis TaxID=1387353 RepID=UPI00283B7752|nr:tetratricopeptide repeat protein [Paludisphaera borealis]MDR3619858.1 tetratricopeptide repeat protein [Paludisphaera borealis]
MTSPLDRILLCVVVLVGGGSEAARADDPKPAGKPAAPRGDLAPPAPLVPGEVVAAMQEGKYDEAIAALRDLRAKAKSDDERAYLSFLSAIAERSAGRRDAARTTLEAALKDLPRGVWAPKIRFELAMIELAAGNLAKAEELARTEALPLLADDRKDRLAEVYQSFAVRLLQPDDPAIPADPKAAWDLLAQARLLAKGETVRASLEFTMGRTSLAMHENARAVQEFQNYIRDHPKGAIGSRPGSRWARRSGTRSDSSTPG